MWCVRRAASARTAPRSTPTSKCAQCLARRCRGGALIACWASSLRRRRRRLDRTSAGPRSRRSWLKSWTVWGGCRASSSPYCRTRRSCASSGAGCVLNGLTARCHPASATRWSRRSRHSPWPWGAVVKDMAETSELLPPLDVEALLDAPVQDLPHTGRRPLDEWPDPGDSRVRGAAGADPAAECRPLYGLVTPSVTTRATSSSSCVTTSRTTKTPRRSCAESSTSATLDRGRGQRRPGHGDAGIYRCERRRRVAIGASRACRRGRADRPAA
jgi:hypothetical protein